MAKKDYYEVLGLTKGATQDEIKKAYRKLSMVHHPDKGGDENLFKEIAEAYEVLSDEDKRKNYDAYGHNAPNQRGGYDPMADFLRRAGFGGGGNPFSQQVRKGQDMYLTIKLSLEEVFTGSNKKFKYQRKESCTHCSGKGGHGIKICTTCNGNGIIMEVINTQYGQIRNGTTCNACQGQGSTCENQCTSCNSEGTTTIEDNIDLNIPAGISDGMKMVMEGKGHAAKDAVAGDLIITIIEQQHETFARVGNDLKMKLKLSYPQLILGDKVEIPTIEGSKIRALIPELSKVGTTLRIPNKGMKQFNTENRGDMLLEVDLLVPTSISDEEKVLIEQLKKLNENVASN